MPEKWFVIDGWIKFSDKVSGKRKLDSTNEERECLVELSNPLGIFPGDFEWRRKGVYFFRTINDGYWAGPEVQNIKYLLKKYSKAGIIIKYKIKIWELDHDKPSFEFKE